MSNKQIYGMAIASDINNDNSNELNTNIYSDPIITEALNYIVGMVFTNPKINDINNLNDNLLEFELFLIQYIIDGFSSMVDKKTLINGNIENKVFFENQWHIIYKSKKITTLSDFDGEDIITLITNKKHKNDIEHDRFIDNKTLIVRKNFISRNNKLSELIELKKIVDNILQTAMNKNVIPLLLAVVNNLTDENKDELKNILSKYKNSSVLVLNSDVVSSIEQLEHDVNSELIYNFRSIINSEIASLVGFSNSIFTAPRTFSYTNNNTTTNIVNRNINKYRALMESVINEFFKNEKINDEIKLPPLIIDTFDINNDVGDDNDS